MPNVSTFVIPFIAKHNPEISFKESVEEIFSSLSRMVSIKGGEFVVEKGESLKFAVLYTLKGDG